MFPGSGDTTSHSTPDGTTDKDKGISKEEGMGAEGLGGGAKSVGGAEGAQTQLTPEQEQAAKDFIWRHINQKGRVCVHYYASLPPEDRRKAYVRKLHMMLTEDEDKHIIESFVLTLG